MRGKAASLAVRLIPSSVGRSRRLAARTNAGAAVSPRATRCPGSPTGTATPLATVRRPILVTEPVTGTDLASRIGRDRITGREATATQRVAVTARLASDPSLDMGQSLDTGRRLLLATALVRATVLVPTTGHLAATVQGPARAVPPLATATPLATALDTAAALVMARPPDTGRMGDLTPLADMDRPAATEATGAGLALSVTGTGHETTIAQAPRTDRVKASDQTRATAPALAMHRVALGAERTVPPMATDTAQAMGPIAGITPAAIQASRVAR